MAKMRIETGEWVVVCDGAKALILENVGDAVFPNLRTREVHAQADAATREPGTAAPPRDRQTKGPGSTGVSAVGGQDSEQRFLTDLAGRLDGALGAGETKGIILVAPPRALGMIRNAYSPTLQRAIRAELDKDYVNVPVHEIEKNLLAA